MKKALIKYPVLLILIPLGLIGVLISFSLVEKNKLPKSILVSDQEYPTWFTIIGTHAILGLVISGFVVLAPHFFVPERETIKEIYKSPCISDIGYRATNTEITSQLKACEISKLRSDAQGFMIGAVILFTVSFLIFKFGNSKLPVREEKKVNKSEGKSVETKIDSLSKLEELKKAGSLSDEEFNKLKNEILNNGS